MQPGINLNPNVAVQVYKSTIMEQASQIADLTVAVQQGLMEIEELKQQLPADEEVQEDESSPN